MSSFWGVVHVGLETRWQIAELRRSLSSFLWVQLGSGHTWILGWHDRAGDYHRTFHCL